MDQPLDRRPLYLDVADRLRELIYRRQLKPGDWVDEVALCGQLGISRTPLREALKVLGAEELVELVPRRGCRVRELDDEVLLELFPVMATLEGLCANLATQKLTPAHLQNLEKIHERLERHAAAEDIDSYYEANREFHRAIQDLAGNRWLNRMSGELRNVLVLARHRQLTAPGRLQDSLNEHRTIMQALRDGNAEAAQQAMHGHICRQEKILREQAEQSSTPGAEEGVAIAH